MHEDKYHEEQRLTQEDHEKRLKALEKKTEPKTKAPEVEKKKK